MGEGVGALFLKPLDRAASEGDLFSKPNGTYTYPTGPGYANNAADLVELRVKPLKRATAFRITLNTLGLPQASDPLAGLPHAASYGATMSVQAAAAGDFQSEGTWAAKAFTLTPPGGAFG